MTSMECVIRKLSPNDTATLSQLLLVFNDVFEWQDYSPPSFSHLYKILSNTQYLVFVALVNDRVIGGLTAYILPQFESVTSIVYIYDVAVKTEHQRSGTGRQLIQSVRDYCTQQEGLTEVFVQADEEDEYAVDFYRKTGGTEMRVRQFSYSLV